MGSLLCPGPQCTSQLVCTLLEWSLCFPHSCGAHKIKPHESSKPNALGLPLTEARPQARDPDEGLRILTPMGETLQYSYFWVCGSLTWRVWDLFVSWKDLSYRLTVTSFLSLSVEYLFWKVWIFIIDVVQHLVVIWGLSWEEVNSRISNMPSCLCSPKFDFNSRNMFFFSFIPFPKLLLLFFSCSVMSNFLHPSNMQGFSVLHYLLELVQTHLHWASDAIQQSHPLFPTSPPALNPSQHPSLIQWVGSSHYVAKVLEFQHQTFQWIFRLDFL